MYAQILKGVVVNVVESPFVVHENISFERIPNDIPVDVDWVWDAGGFIAPPEPEPPTPEEEQRRKIAQIDAETSASVVAGFDYQIDGQTLHFSYDANDQQNFADTANVATLAQMGVPGLPTTITWNGWQIERDADGREASRTLRRIDLTMTEFLGLYTQGALTHKATQMEIGSQRKAALYEAA